MQMHRALDDAKPTAMIWLEDDLIPLALPTIKIFAFKANKGIIALNYEVKF